MRKKNNLKTAKSIPSALSVANPNSFKPGTQATSPSATPAPALTITAPQPAHRPPKPATSTAEPKPAQISRVNDSGKPIRKSIQEVEVKFILEESRARKVSLCGTFNGWSTEDTPMKQDGPNQWAATVRLAPGRYEYKFLVDGTWRNDPRARENIPNQFGSLNSVIEVR